MAYGSFSFFFWSDKCMIGKLIFFFQKYSTKVFWLLIPPSSSSPLISVIFWKNVFLMLCYILFFYFIELKKKGILHPPKACQNLICCFLVKKIIKWPPRQLPKIACQNISFNRRFSPPPTTKLLAQPLSIKNGALSFQMLAYPEIGDHPLLNFNEKVSTFPKIKMRKKKKTN